MEGAHKDDNWMSIGLAAALILNKLRNKKQIDGETEESRKAEEACDEHASGKLPVVRR